MQFNVGMLLTMRSRLEPEKIGLTFEGQTFTYREINESCNRWAHAFTGLKVKKGDRIGILLRNCNEFLEAYFGLVKIGAVLVPLNWRLTQPELQYICRNSGVRSLIYGEEFSQAVEAIGSKLEIQDYVCVGAGTHRGKDLSFINQFPTSEPRIAASGDDAALVVYTSGTTGLSKGAVMTHENLFWGSTLIVVAFDIRSEDRVLAVMPLFHLVGLTWPGMVDVQKGCTTVLMRDFDPLKILVTIQNEKVNEFMMVPTMLHRIAQVPNFDRYLTTVRWIASGGAPLSVPMIRRFTSLGIEVGQLYGCTEGGVTVLTPKKGLEKQGSVGVPQWGQENRVVDEKGNDVTLGEVGEILVRGPAVMKEYWNNPEATKEAIRDGWFHTGDLGRLDDDGYLYIVDRKTDMIKSGGEKIYPIEIENVLSAHPEIAEVAVIGEPDDVWGERVCAVILPKAGETLTPEEIVDFCQGKLARYKIPKRVVLREQPLPRNAAGKVLKRALREEHSAG